MLSTTLAIILSCLATADTAKPNIVVLVADDLGYGDLGCFGHSRIKTPNLDRMAGEGVRLTSFYSGAPICSPSRAALFTGRNPNRVGVRDWIRGDSGVHLPRTEITIAQRLKSAGYTTCLSGKWHLNSRFNGSEPTPGDFGFDHWFATQNNTAHQNPPNFVRNGKRVAPLKGHASTLVVDEALKFIADAGEKAFAVFVTFHAPHEQVAAPESYRAMYSDLKDQTMRDYYGSVSLIDHEVGRLLEALDTRGLRDKTLVLFTSDNGPQALLGYPNAIHSHGSAGPFRGMKLSMYEGGYRVPAIVRWPARVKPGTECAEPIGFTDLMPSLCALAGVAPPADRTLDGVNILPLLDGKSVDRPRPLHWQFDYAEDGPWRVSMRRGPWKLLADAKRERFALYHVVEDAGETRDRSMDQPELVQEMKMELEQLYVPEDKKYSLE
ncbi:arylsulfatase A [Singulisphaera sp. GP187]|uniref:sulfatase family protein n=1 Tax=Singulisphaera sp. GP187 TaxID=1882752 RepID=UPI000926DE01|nr:sulfatase-like hydrolase/transferase [Singulisphaera sp. GP187]SIO59324.1 arylsulfatase A [Singulisphaera sp. GP187]